MTTEANLWRRLGVPVVAVDTTTLSIPRAGAVRVDAVWDRALAAVALGKRAATHAGRNAALGTEIDAPPCVIRPREGSVKDSL